MPLAACGQFCATNILTTNLTNCLTLLRKASSAGAKALFLPEASDYIASTPAESLSLCKPISSSPFVLGLQAEARKLHLPINVGIHEPTTDGKNDRVRNVSIWIDADGNIVQKYQKIHMFDVDIDKGPKIFESRKEYRAWIENRGTIRDFYRENRLRFPETSLQLRRRGAQVLSYPSAFTIPTGQAHWEILLRARAIETQSYVIAAAHIGRHNEKRASYGHSMIVDPWGRVLAECEKVGEGEVKDAKDVEPQICVAEVDLGVLEKVRREAPLKRRFDVYPEV